MVGVQASKLNLILESDPSSIVESSHDSLTLLENLLLQESVKSRSGLLLNLLLGSEIQLLSLLELWSAFRDVKSYYHVVLRVNELLSVV